MWYTAHRNLPTCLQTGQMLDRCCKIVGAFCYKQTRFIMYADGGVPLSCAAQSMKALWQLLAAASACSTSCKCSLFSPSSKQIECDLAPDADWMCMALATGRPLKNVDMSGLSMVLLHAGGQGGAGDSSQGGAAKESTTTVGSGATQDAMQARVKQIRMLIS